MEFIVRHGILARMGLEAAEADSFRCGYCEQFIAGSDLQQVVSAIKKHVATQHRPPSDEQYIE